MKYPNKESFLNPKKVLQLSQKFQPKFNSNSFYKKFENIKD